MTASPTSLALLIFISSGPRLPVKAEIPPSKNFAIWPVWVNTLRPNSNSLVMTCVLVRYAPNCTFDLILMKVLLLGLS